MNKARIVARRSTTLLLQSPRCWLSTTDTAADGDDFVYGTVKMYVRKKAYGFIIPDATSDAPPVDIFVHHTGIVGSEMIETAIFPYLETGERVRYQVGTKEGNDDRPKAANLTFEDGSQVPIYRKEYTDIIAKSEYTTLGEAVDDILTDDAVADKMVSILEAHAKAAAAIEEVRKRHEHFNSHGAFTSDGEASS